MARVNLRGLRVSLLLLLTVALFPLGLISLAQTRNVLVEAAELNRSNLLDLTVAEAARERTVLEEAIGAASGLGAFALVADAQTCTQGFRAFLQKNPRYVFAGFIETSGLMTCSTATEPLDFAGTEAFERALAYAEPYIEFVDQGAVSGEAVVVIVAPVLDAGELQGFATISIPSGVLKQQDIQEFDGQKAELLAITKEGDVLGNAASVDAQDLPADVSVEDLFQRANSTFVAPDGSGVDRLYAVTQPVAQTYLTVGIWPTSVLIDDGSPVKAFLPLIFPMLMWLAGMLVAYFGINRLVIRHLSSLRSAMRQFALGERGPQSVLRLESPPEEFRDAERAFNRMGLLITEGEARQKADLRDKEVLLREVHHRVKNNLQLIASIMNMQSRNAVTAEAKHILQGLQRRVRGLAMLHRSLYTAPETTQVDGAELIKAVVTDVSVMLPARKIDVKTDLACVWLFPDQAVPLSMWAAEALTNAVKYLGDPANGDPRLSIMLSWLGPGRVELRIENSVGTPLVDTEALESGGLGTQLMSAFASQLDGTEEITDSDESYGITLTFDVEDFQADAPDDAVAVKVDYAKAS
ncbi:MAG: sensor histidine kinase [Pseudomonadota bacterium]